jgi:hypothetical protein
MREPKIQPLVPFILSSSKIVLLLPLTHFIPFLSSFLININIKQLSANEERKVVDTDSNKDFVSFAVKRFVVVAIDLLTDQQGLLG